ncbi:MAG TPA: hypothetical protein VGL89_13995 [Candidatus Koribacter sp.]
MASITSVSPFADVGHRGWLAQFPALSWIFLLLSSAIMIATIRQWVIILPGAMVAAIPGTLMLLFAGEFNRQAASHSIAGILIVFFISTTALTSTFQRRELNVVDRVALMGFVTCLAVGMTTKRDRIMLAAATIGLVFLLLGWAVNFVSIQRLWTRRS